MEKSIDMAASLIELVKIQQDGKIEARWAQQRCEAVACVILSVNCDDGVEEGKLVFYRKG